MPCNGPIKQQPAVSRAERESWAKERVIAAARLAVAAPEDRAFLCALASRIDDLDTVTRYHEHRANVEAVLPKTARARVSKYRHSSGV